MSERMKKVTTVGDIVLCRRSDGTYRLEISDSRSIMTSVEVSLTAEQVAKMVTGAYAGDVQVTCRRPDLFGKVRIKERRQVFCPITTYDKAALEEWLLANYHEDGWEVDPYLGSQNSTKTVEGGQLLNFKVERWTDE